MTEIIILTISFIIFIIFICLYINSKENENYFIENSFEVIFDELNDNKKRYIFKKSCPTCKYAKKIKYRVLRYFLFNYKHCNVNLNKISFINLFCVLNILTIFLLNICIIL